MLHPIHIEPVDHVRSMLELHRESIALNNEARESIKPVAIRDQRSERVVVRVAHISGKKSGVESSDSAFITRNLSHWTGKPER